MTYDAIDCQGFAGGFTLGMVQAGFHLIAKKEMTGGFGARNCEENRELLGYDWETQIASETGYEWDTHPADVVFGNPPCSGFSLLSRSDFRGPDSTINSCMWAFERYVGRVMPQIAVFESVQQAYTGGLVLMRALRQELEATTGVRWGLYHVLHNAASVGGAAIRKRYFWVVSRIPFGLHMPEVTRVPLLEDVIGDLQGLGNTWERQPYRRDPSWWARGRRDPMGVDGHHWRQTPAIRRALDLLHGTHWNAKEHLAIVAKRYYETHGCLPASWPESNLEKFLGNDWQMGFNQLTRWRHDKMCRVITGGGLDLTMHPHEDRTLTHREVARIQGFPDTWRILPLRGTSGLQLTWGKGIPVDCGRWIGRAIQDALDGKPQLDDCWTAGEEQDEYIYDNTNAYRAVSLER